MKYVNTWIDTFYCREKTKRQLNLICSLFLILVLAGCSTILTGRTRKLFGHVEKHEPDSNYSVAGLTMTVTARPNPILWLAHRRLAITKTDVHGRFEFTLDEVFKSERLYLAVIGKTRIEVISPGNTVAHPGCVALDAPRFGEDNVIVLPVNFEPDVLD